MRRRVVASRFVYPAGRPPQLQTRVVARAVDLDTAADVAGWWELAGWVTAIEPTDLRAKAA